MRTAAIFLSISGLVPVATAADHWPQFRGPSGQGHVDSGAAVPIRWSERENVAWKTPIPGRGWSSPVVFENQIWVTTAIESAASDEEREQRLAGDPMAPQLDVDSRIVLRAIGVDRESGDILHDIELGSVENPDPIHSLNSHASPTPVIEAGRLYCHFGTYGTWCVDTRSGDVIWERVLAIKHNVGPGSSPVIVGDNLVLVCDGADQQFIAALNKQNGDINWRTPRPPIRTTDGDMRKAYCTPLLISTDGESQLVIPGAQWVVAYEPRSGAEIWRVDHGEGFSNVPRPVFANGRVFVCTGFMSPQLWAIRVDGHGDVTETHVEWKQTRQISKKPSPLLLDDLLYVIHDRGVATCFDAASGETVWRERVGGNFSASPLHIGDRIYVFDHEGTTTVFKSGREYAELAKNEIDGQIMATPAAVGDALILRSDSHLYRIDQDP